MSPCTYSEFISDKGGKTTQSGKTVSSTNGAGQPACTNMKLDHYLTPYTKISSKWIKHLNVTLDTITLLQENIGRTFSAINHSNIFFQSISQNNGGKKPKINKWDLLKLKRQC